MTPDWTPLTTELARWSEAGLTLPLWWRDDDATAPTPALSRLAALGQSVDMAVHVAVIPAHAQPELPKAFGPGLIPIVHGWAHDNHAPTGQKKAEFGAHRPLAPMRAEAEAGLSCMTGLFGATCLPVFVPPWNRIDPALSPDLAALGYRYLSTFKPRAAVNAAAGLEQVNTHLDPIDWKGHRGLVAPERLIAQLVRDLSDRRTGEADAAEAYGLLTHHLVHDEAVWGFVEALLTQLRAGPVTPWTFPGEPKQ